MLKKLLVIAVVIGAGAASVYGGQQYWDGYSADRSRDEWFACHQMSDCVITQNMCHFPVAVRKLSRFSYDVYAKHQGMVVDCVHRGTWTNEAVVQAICQQNRCALSPEPEFSRETP